MGTNNRRRIVLGAAAFGQPYGIANSRETLELSDLNNILEFAWKHGIKRIDCAPAYGAAEGRIGTWMARSRHHFEIISKLPPMKELQDSKIDDHIRRYLGRTLDDLQSNMLAGYLTHAADDYLRPSVRESLGSLKSEGIVQFIGFSAYTPDDIAAVLETGIADAVQVPMSVFDRRMEDSGMIERCRKADVRIFARSIFTQGLLFRDPETLPEYFRAIVPSLRRLRTLSHETSLSIAHLALSFFLDRYKECDIVLGCYHASEMEEICRIVAAEPLESTITDELCAIGRNIPEQLIDPRIWPISD